MAQFTAYSFLHLARTFLAYDVEDICFAITVRRRFGWPGFSKT
jgi:hypothetical protein